MTKSKAILILLAVYSLFTSSWGASVAFHDTSAAISTVAMMGMLGSLTSAAVILASLGFPPRQRRVLTLVLLVWHVPEALLIATAGMGVPPETRSFGVTIHIVYCVLALLAWRLDRDDVVVSPSAALA